MFCIKHYQSLSKKNQDLLLNSKHQSLNANGEDNWDNLSKEAKEEQILPQLQPTDFKDFQKQLFGSLKSNEGKDGYIFDLNTRDAEKKLIAFAEDVIASELAQLDSLPTAAKPLKIQISAAEQDRKQVYRAFLLAKKSHHITITFPASKGLSAAEKSAVERQVEGELKQVDDRFKRHVNGREEEEKSIGSRLRFWDRPEQRQPTGTVADFKEAMTAVTVTPLEHMHTKTPAGQVNYFTGMDAKQQTDFMSDLTESKEEEVKTTLAQNHKKIMPAIQELNMMQYFRLLSEEQRGEIIGKIPAPTEAAEEGDDDDDAKHVDEQGMAIEVAYKQLAKQSKFPETLSKAQRVKFIQRLGEQWPSFVADNYPDDQQTKLLEALKDTSTDIKDLVGCCDRDQQTDFNELVSGIDGMAPCPFIRMGYS